MATDTPLSVQIGSFLLNDANGIIIQQILDANSAPVELDVHRLARKHGGKVVSFVHAPRPITIGGIIVGTSFADSEAKLDALKLAMIGVNLNLDINNGTYNKRYIVSTQGSLTVTRAPGEVSFTKFSITLSAVDQPYGLDAVQGAASATITNALTATGINADSATATPVFSGSATPAVQYKYTMTSPGSITGLELIDQNQAKALQITQSFVAGDIVIIDADQKQVLKNNLSIDFTGQFPNPLPGSNPITTNVYTSTGLIIDQSQTQANFGYPCKRTGILAQSFVASTTGPYSRVALVLANAGVGQDANFSIQTDSAGSPSGTVITFSSAVIAAASLNNNPNWYSINFSPSSQLTATNVYWLVINPVSATNDPVNYLQVYTNYPDSYTSGKLRTSADNGTTWTDVKSGFSDMAFKVFKGTTGENNQTNDSITNLYDETFSTTTKEDIANTTANWNTAGPYLTLANQATAQQQNTTTANSGSDLFNGNGTIQEGTQSFTPASNCNITSTTVSLGWTAGGGTGSSSNGNVNWELRADSSGSPSGSLGSGSALASGYLGSVSGGLANYTASMNVALTSGTVYWFVFGSASGYSGNDVLVVGGVTSNAYAGGSAKRWVSGWTTFTSILDLYFTTTMVNYAVTQVAQTLELASTAADIISVSQVALTVLPAGTSFAGTASADNGTTFFSIPRDLNPFDTDNIPLVVSNQLKYKAALTGLQAFTAYVTEAKLYWKKGICLDATTKRGIQSITPVTTGNVQRLDIYGCSVGTPGAITMRIETDAAGVPSGTLANAAATLTIANPFVATFGWATFSFTSPFSLTASTKYWIVFYAAATLSNTSKYLIQANNNLYAAGSGGKSINSGTNYTVFSSNCDFLFRFYQASGGNFLVNLSVDYVKRYL